MGMHLPASTIEFDLPNAKVAARATVLSMRSVEILEDLIMCELSLFLFLSRERVAA